MRQYPRGLGLVGLVGLFLTSKVRLHCDDSPVVTPDASPHALFLTSKVRLHCDEVMFRRTYHQNGNLFLTSKARLHCDHTACRALNSVTIPFPNLKSQAPLRRELLVVDR